MTAVEGGIVHQAGEGKSNSMMGVNLTFKAVSEDTGGAWAFFEYQAPPGFGGPPPHLHRKMIEAFYVIEGQLEVTLGEKSVKLGPGAFALIPPGVAHTFANRESSPTVFLGLLSPGGFERYFEELPGLVEKHGFPPPPEVMRELGQRYDFEPAP